MMHPKKQILLLLSLIPLSATAQQSELTRLRGFAEHQKQDRQFNKAREAGEVAFLEETDQWESARRKAATQYKKEAKRTEMTDDGPEARADAAAKVAEARAYDKLREAYAKSHKEFDRANYPDLVSEMTELGLDQERPRFDFSKRKFTNGGGSSSGGSSLSRPSGGSSFPPPPTTFDDFGNDGGFAPSPDDFGDVPPPPPPPPFPGDDFGNDYIPPPPPPFDGEETQF